MATELLIALEREIPELGSGFAAIELASDSLDRFADALGVRPLSEFVRVDPDVLATRGDELSLDDFSDSGEVEAIVAVPPTEGPEEQPTNWWCDPREGLNTIRAYLEHLGRNPRAVRDADAVARELRSYQRVLERAVRENIRFKLVLDIGWAPEPGSSRRERRSLQNR